MLDFTQFSHLSCDCYGTLIDWERGILSALMPLLARHGVVIEEQGLLEAYAEAEDWAERISGDIAAGRGHRSYRQILAETLDALGSKLGFEARPEERDILARSLADWPPFPDSIEALERLATRYELVILSNIDRDLFEGTSQVLGVPFSAVITAEELEVYKPSPRFFEMARERLEVPRDQWLHVAQSCFHDIAPAQAFGLSTVHIDRRRDLPGTGATPPSSAVADLTCGSLAELCTLMDL